MKVHADTSLCCGAGMCALTAPEVFDQDDTGTVMLLLPEPPAEHRTATEEAVRLCPSGALSLTQ